MNNVGVIACGVGLQDGLNPCIFMTCAAFIVHGFWLKARSLKSGWLRILFVLAYASSFLEFNFGPAQIFVLRKEFVFAAKIVYFVLGVGTFILGVIFFKDWFLLRRAGSAHNEKKATKSFAGNFLVVCLITVILGVFLSALATTWPVNTYILLLGNIAFLKGQWQMSMLPLTSYIFFSMWSLWFVWAFLSVKDLRPSMLKIFCASIFFTASTCVILIFK